MSPVRTVTFGVLCADCPLRERCTAPAEDGRPVTIHPHEGLLRAARSQARTQNGRRVRLRHIGTARNDAWLHNLCAAINLRTLLRHGLTRAAGPPAPPLQALPLPPGPLPEASPADGGGFGEPETRSAGHTAIHRIRVIQGAS